MSESVVQRAGAPPGLSSSIRGATLGLEDPGYHPGKPAVFDWGGPGVRPKVTPHMNRKSGTYKPTEAQIREAKLNLDRVIEIAANLPHLEVKVSKFCRECGEGLEGPRAQAEGCGLVLNHCPQCGEAL